MTAQRRRKCDMCGAEMQYAWVPTTTYDHAAGNLIERDTMDDMEFCPNGCMSNSESEADHIPF